MDIDAVIDTGTYVIQLLYNLNVDLYHEGFEDICWDGRILFCLQVQILITI